MLSRAIKRSSLVAAAAAIAVGLGITQASAAPWTFTPQHPYYKGDDPRGDFTAQIKYSTNKFQMGWQLSTATAAPATGLMSETANLTCNGRRVGHDSHPAVSPRYFVHMSVPLGSGMTSCKYDLQIHETFPIGRGTRTIDLDFPFVVTLV